MTSHVTPESSFDFQADTTGMLHSQNMNMRKSAGKEILSTPEKKATGIQIERGG